MAQQIVGEETTAGHHLESLHAACGWQIGLIVGATIEKKTYVLNFFPTPVDGEELPENVWSLNDLPQIQKHLLRMDVEWLKEHKRQGGLHVVGMYAFGSHMKIFQAKLQQMSDIDISVFISSTTKKVDCRLVRENQPATWHVKSMLNRWGIVKCSFPLDVRLPICSPSLNRDTSTKNVFASLQSALKNQIEVFNSVLFLSQSCLLLEDDEHEFERFGLNMESATKVTAYRTRPLDDLPSTLSDTSTTHLAHLTGSIQLLAYIPPKASGKIVLQNLRKDLSSTLMDRLAVLGDAIADSEESSDDESKSELSNLLFPRRVLYSVGDTIIHWYAINAESDEDAQSMLTSILGIDTTYVTALEKPSSTRHEASPTVTLEQTRIKTQSNCTSHERTHRAANGDNDSSYCKPPSEEKIEANMPNLSTSQKHTLLHPANAAAIFAIVVAVASWVLGYGLTKETFQ